MPQKEYEKIAKENASGGILKQNPSMASTTKSTKRDGSRSKLTKNRSKSRTLLKN